MVWTSAEFGARLQLETLFLAYGIRLVGKDGVVRAWTNIRRTTTLPTLVIPIRPGRTVTVPGATYDHRACLRVTDAQFTDDISQTDNMEMTLVFGEALSESQVRAGLLENAPFDLLVYDWKKPVGDGGSPNAFLRMRGDLGERTIVGQEVTWKLRSLSNRARGDILETTSRDSRGRWGDPEWSAAIAGLSQSHDGFPWEFTGQVAEVDPLYPRRRFRLSGLPVTPDDRFADGMMWATGGANAGFSCGVLRHEPSSGWLTSTQRTPQPLAVGQTIRVRVRAPRDQDEWILFTGSAMFCPAEKGIPTTESANRTPS